MKSGGQQTERGVKTNASIFEREGLSVVFSPRLSLICPPFVSVHAYVQ